MKRNQAATHPLVIEMKMHEADAKEEQRKVALLQMSNEDQTEAIGAANESASYSWAAAHAIAKELKADPSVCLKVVRKVR